jgi:hypothetical protein
MDSINGISDNNISIIKTHMVHFLSQGEIPSELF